MVIVRDRRLAADTGFGARPTVAGLKHYFLANQLEFPVAVCLWDDVWQAYTMAFVEEFEEAEDGLVVARLQTMEDPVWVEATLLCRAAPNGEAVPFLATRYVARANSVRAIVYERTDKKTVCLVESHKEGRKFSVRDEGFDNQDMWLQGGGSVILLAVLDQSPFPGLKRWMRVQLEVSEAIRMFVLALSPEFKPGLREMLAKELERVYRRSLPEAAMRIREIIGSKPLPAGADPDRAPFRRRGRELLALARAASRS